MKHTFLAAAIIGLLTACNSQPATESTTTEPAETTVTETPETTPPAPVEEAVDSIATGVDSVSANQ